MRRSFRLISQMAVSITALGIAAGCATQNSTTIKADADSPRDSLWKLIWSDEFDGPEIDKTVWTHETFPGEASGNRELQHYTDRPANSYIENGMLVIKAKREDYKGHDYTSARMTTRNGFAFRYGRAEARIKIPSTQGIWPAFWMMPRDSVYGGWPHSGEIDILESVNIADETYGTIHFGNPQHVHSGGAHTLSDGALHSDDFHVYSVEWEPQEIRWYVDGELFSTKNKWMTQAAAYPAPFDQDFYLILNVAVGGYWPGPPDETSVFPQTMEVDWVRVYQMDNEFPKVEIVSPGDRENVSANTPITFKVNASDPDGTITRVELVQGRNVLATDSEPPFELTMAGLADGCYDDLTVLAFDDAGVPARANRVLFVGEGCPQGPYGGTPIAIPGEFEAEDFDEGWSGEAWHDTDWTNNGGQARHETGVDIGRSGDALYIGWTEPDEWIEYHVDVAESGAYTLNARVASGADGGPIVLSDTLHPENEATITVLSTGDWDTFVPVTSEGTLKLSAGPTVLRLFFPEGGVNVDKISLTKATE
ncbi:family 16 glycosylhydrolase [bacterium]|nr:family 16 glycosylhydrolase [bacterium]